MQLLRAPQGDFTLERYPTDGDPTLRAWDAADELLLQYVADNGLTAQPKPGRLVILNDGSGALAIALAESRPVSINDSFLEQLATRSNLERNDLDIGYVSMLGSLDAPPAAISVLLAKVPRTLSLLEDQLHRLRGSLTAGAVVVAGGMTKNIHNSTTELFERLIGPTTTSLAKKKARLIFATVDPTLEVGASPWPATFTAGEVEVTSHANVFSAGKVDFGTAFLLEHLPEGPVSGTIVDMGCGNGLLGVHAAKQHPDADLVFLDESALAVASAEATFRTNLGPERAARFVVGDTLSTLQQGEIAPGTVDLVLTNPPFHVHNARTDMTAWRMFTSARRSLRAGGELWVVGNRHLGYHAKLKRIFGNCQVAASNPKFVVLRATRR